MVIYVDDLLANLDNNKFSFDTSLTPEAYASLTTNFNLQLATATYQGQEKEVSDYLSEKLGQAVSVQYQAVKDLLDEGKKADIRIVISDEVLGKQTPQTRSDILGSYFCLVFASQFTGNESLVNIDYHKTIVGRAACTIESKLKFGHLRDRIKVGLFLESKWCKPAMMRMLQDDDRFEFMPLSFKDVPAMPFDYVINRANNYESLFLMKQDANAKKVLDNYLKYEEKNRKTIFVDKYEAGKVTLNRSEFMEELKLECETENERIGKDVF